MKNLICISTLCLCFCFVQQAKAQKSPKTISAADQKAIVALFKGVDPSLYRLQFNKGKTVHGTRQVSMQELEQVKTIRRPGTDAGIVVLIVSDDGIVYIFAVSKSGSLTSALGAEKVKKLNVIASKYAAR